MKQTNLSAKFFIEPFWNNCDFTPSIEVKAVPWDLRKQDSGNKITDF